MEDKDYRKSMKYKYAVTIILFNPDLTALERVNYYKEFFLSILVVDNTESYDYATDELLNKINRIKSDIQIEYHGMGQNAGMSVALNFAYQWAINKEIDYILTMDQDTEFSINSILKIVEEIESDAYVNAAMFTSNWRKIYKHGNKESYGCWKYGNETIITTSAMTSGTFYNISIIRKYLPLPDLFIGMVDEYINCEIERDGKFGVMVGEARLSQRIGSPVDDNAWNKLVHKIILSADRYYYMGRNSKYLLKKHKNIKSIKKRIRNARLRILGNIILCEKDKIHKIIMWIKGAYAISDKKECLGKYGD